MDLSKITVTDALAKVRNAMFKDEKFAELVRDLASDSMMRHKALSELEAANRHWFTGSEMCDKRSSELDVLEAGQAPGRSGRRMSHVIHYGEVRSDGIYTACGLVGIVTKNDPTCPECVRKVEGAAKRELEDLTDPEGRLDLKQENDDA